MRGYCVKCNRGKPKGQWTDVEMIDPVEFTKETSRGIKRMVKGKCPVCGSAITKIIGK